MTEFSDQELRHAFANLKGQDRRTEPVFEALCPAPDEPTGAQSAAFPASSGTTAWDTLLGAVDGEHATALADARKRYGPRRLCQQLLFVSHKEVRNRPHRSAELARWAQGVLFPSGSRHGADPQYASLWVQAVAGEANALRVAGDLHGARRLFQTLATDPCRARLSHRELARLSSLEASLCIAQRQVDAAHEKIAEAEALYRQVGDPRGVATCLIQRANLAGTFQEAERQLDLMERASTLLNPETDSALAICTTTGRINSLCDLDRPGEAREVLVAHWSEFVGQEDPYYTALGQCLRGRVAFGLDRLAEAEHAYRCSLDLLLDVGRHYDAALACLFLAEALLVQGKLEELENMASDALEVFRAQGGTRDALAALSLLAESARAKSVTSASLLHLRHDLEAPA